MKLRPTQCCAIGSYECQVPMPLNGRRQDIDYCIADIVVALNAANIETVASCCGHNQSNANILLADGREINIDKQQAVRPWEHEYDSAKCFEQGFCSCGLKSSKQDDEKGLA